MFYRTLGLCALVVGCACSGPRVAGGSESSADEYSALDVGADYATRFHKINRAPFRSEDHGNRWVNTYVNETGRAALLAGKGGFPIGSIVVKESFEDANGTVSTARGPTFVMEKRTAGYDSGRGDWWWAIHWEKPLGPLAKTLAGPIYWRGKTQRVDYCYGCHKKWSDRDAVAVGIPPENLNGPVDGGPRAADVQDAGDVDF